MGIYKEMVRRLGKRKSLIFMRRIMSCQTIIKGETAISLMWIITELKKPLLRCITLQGERQTSFLDDKGIVEKIKSMKCAR